MDAEEEEEDDDEVDEDEDEAEAAGSDFLVSADLPSDDPLLADVSAVWVAFEGTGADEPFLLSVR